MEHKKVIDKPTHKTSPDIVVRGQLDNVVGNVTELAPRDFNTARRINDIKNKYLFDNPKSIKRKIEHFFSDDDHQCIVAPLFIMGVAANFLLVVCSFTYIVDLLPIYDPIKQIVILIGLAASVPGVPWAMSKLLNTSTDTAHIALSRKDRKAFTNAEFVNLDYRLPHQLDPYARTYVLNINELFNYDEDILDTIDLSEVRQAYDNYIDLYAFLRVNADVMSQSLYTEYRDELHRQGTALNHEINVLHKLIRDNEESKAELLSQQQEITQDMIDDDVRRAMPLIKTKEL